jgi:hypothetical protein
MEIFFTDPTEIPLPPEDIRIRKFHADPWPDKRRVRVNLEITPFQNSPNIEIEIRDADGNEVASLTIIETIHPKIDLTIHLRGPEPAGVYTAAVMIYYYEAEEQTTSTEGGPASEALPPLPSKFKLVDQAETTFQI